MRMSSGHLRGGSDEGWCIDAPRDGTGKEVGGGGLEQGCCGDVLELEAHPLPPAEVRVGASSSSCKLLRPIALGSVRVLDSSTASTADGVDASEGTGGGIVELVVAD